MCQIHVEAPALQFPFISNILYSICIIYYFYNIETTIYSFNIIKVISGTTHRQYINNRNKEKIAYKIFFSFQEVHTPNSIFPVYRKDLYGFTAEWGSNGENASNNFWVIMP